jgi:hypothetical protein
VVRVAEGDDGNSTLTVDGPADLIGAVVLLIVAAFGDESGDCGDENCPVHGGSDDEGDLAESA